MGKMPLSVHVWEIIKSFSTTPDAPLDEYLKNITTEVLGEIEGTLPEVKEERDRIMKEQLGADWRNEKMHKETFSYRIKNG